MTAWKRQPLPIKRNCWRNSQPSRSRSPSWQAKKSRLSSLHAPGNGAPIGGLKVVAESGWFAARPSGTENIYKIYAESFRGADHLRRILEEAQTIVSDALAAAPVPEWQANPRKHARMTRETLTNAFEDSVQNKFGAETMSKQIARQPPDLQPSTHGSRGVRFPGRACPGHALVVEPCHGRSVARA